MTDTNNTIYVRETAQNLSLVTKRDDVTFATEEEVMAVWENIIAKYRPAYEELAK